jgi:hypothetical protein
MPPQLAEIQKSINAAQQVIRRNVIVEIECVKQLPMSARPLSHHPRFSRSNALTSSIATKRALSREFFNTIGQLETFIGDAKISRKQSPADGHETLSEGVAWFDFH